MIPFAASLFGGAAAGAPSDPNWSSVVLLAQFNEANGSTTFTDATGRHTLTSNNSAATSTTGAPSFQATSLLLGSSKFVSMTDSADWDFGSGDFTVEYFGKQASALTQAALAQFGSTNKAWAMFEGTTLEFDYSTDGTNNAATPPSASFTSTSWSHRALSRVGNTMYLCANGTILATKSVTGVTINNSTRPLVIGGNNDGTTAIYGGNIAALRITKGVGRYSGSVSGSYTVPSQPYPTS